MLCEGTKTLLGRERCTDIRHQASALTEILTKSHGCRVILVMAIFVSQKHNGKTTNKIEKLSADIYLLVWVSRWTFLLPAVQTWSTGVRKIPEQEGMYAACHSLWSSPLSAFVQSGPNPPPMTEVARGGEICACIVQGTVPLYYDCKLF